MTQLSLLELQDFINKNCRRQDGKFLGSCSTEKWWNKRNFKHILDQIISLTSFLSGNFIFAQRLWHITENKLYPSICLNNNCNKQLPWKDGRYSMYCCRSCIDIARNVEKFKATCIERYGASSPMKVPAFKEKLKSILIEKYGVEYYSQTDEFKEKFKTTCTEKYGVDNPSKSEEVREKFKTTCIERYGHEYALQNKDILEKRSKTNRSLYGGNSPMNSEIVKETHRQSVFEKYGVVNNKHLLLSETARETLANVPLLEEFLKTKSATEIARDLDVDTTTVINYLKKHGIHDQLKLHSTSILEVNFSNFLNEYQIPHERNNRTLLNGKELDIYIPEHNLAIELCGVYWHSEINGSKDKTYHYDKWKRCKDLGITLLTYFDDEIESSWEIIKSKILYMTKNLNSVKIGARQVTIKTPTNIEETEFLNTNHVQGSLKARTYKIGAYYNNKLIGILCATQRKDYLEITRYATDINYNCSGLFSKLLKYMINELKFSGTIVSFSDNCHSNGNLYKMSNFSIDKVLESGYSYTLSGKPRENRQQYMKSKIAKKFNISIDDKTEWELMQSLGYDRVWDCGKTKWIKTI